MGYFVPGPQDNEGPMKEPILYYFYYREAV